MNKKIYLVGGAVRDQLLGIKFCDKDYVAVGYSEDDFKHLERVGKDFPVFLLEDGSELALARSEKKTTHGYNGFITDTKNISLIDDLKRRDLTINSIAYDLDTKQYIDPYGGRSDIDNKILRHTSIAFLEDPLRVLRIARIYAKLGAEWRIASDTLNLIISMQDEMQYLHQNRIYKELEKLFYYDTPSLFFIFLKKIDFLNYIFPSLKVIMNNEKLFLIIMELIDKIDSKSIDTSLTILYYYETHENLEIDLHLSKQRKSNIKSLLSLNKIVQSINFDSIELLASQLYQLKNKKHLVEKFLKINKTIVEIERKNGIFNTKEINSQYLLDIYDQICSYSPKQWIESASTKPSSKQIAIHIKNYNLQLIKKHKNSIEELFIF